MKNKQQLEDLIVDERMAELCELQRTSDEIFDVINLFETQHSDIMSWMFDAREGHGQGDEILRDLLMAASVAATVDGCQLSKESTTGQFFSHWPPSRIRTTSFGAAFIARELGLEDRKKTDLFVIDAQNKLIIVIENKAGTPQREAQLDSYRRSIATAVTKNPKLRKYEQVCIAMDKRFDRDDASPKACADSWLHIGYDWLKASAKRALMHVERGNSAARLVVSYCEGQTDWDSPHDEKCLSLAAELHQSHQDAILYLLDLSKKRLEHSWFEKEDSEPYLLFLLQNKGIVKLLEDTRGMAFVKAAILTDNKDFEKDRIRHKRVWLNICPSNWEEFVWKDSSGEDCWPVHIEVQFSDDSQSKYKILLRWSAKKAASERDADVTREILERVDDRFGRHQNSETKRVVMGESLTLGELITEINTLNAQLSQALEDTLFELEEDEDDDEQDDD